MFSAVSLYIHSEGGREASCSQLSVFIFTPRVGGRLHILSCYGLVTLPKKWAEPGPLPNINFGKVKNSRLGRAFSAHYHTDLC